MKTFFLFALLLLGTQLTFAQGVGRSPAVEPYVEVEPPYFHENNHKLGQAYQFSNETANASATGWFGPKQMAGTFLVVLLPFLIAIAVTRNSEKKSTTTESHQTIVAAPVSKVEVEAVADEKYSGDAKILTFDLSKRKSKTEVVEVDHEDDDHKIKKAS